MESVDLRSLLAHTPFIARYGCTTTSVRMAEKVNRRS